MIKHLLLLLSVFGFVAAAQPSDEAAPATGGDTMDHSTPSRAPAKKKSTKSTKSSKKKPKKKKPKKKSM